MLMFTDRKNNRMIADALKYRLALFLITITTPIFIYFV